MGGLLGTLHQSLRSEIEQHRRARGYTLSKLGDLTGINPGTLSEILNGKPPRAITISQLDALAEVFGYEPGWMYELYPDECLYEGKISRPRLIPYLIRSAENGRKDCIEAVASQLLENPKNISILFTVAEQLYEDGKLGKAVPFYEYVIENEKDSYSTQFVMSHYRLFQAILGTNADENEKAVIRFSPYRKRLPETDQLDALLNLSKVCFTLQKWSEAETYADELRGLSKIIYQDKLQKRRKNRTTELIKTERPLVYYYGMGYLYKGLVLQMQGAYSQSKEYVQAYADLHWFELLDDEGIRIVERFTVFARANFYTLEVLMGNEKIIKEYTDYLAEQPVEILPGLVTIMEAANKYHFCVDEVLLRLSGDIARFHERTMLVNMVQHLQYRYQKAKYDFTKGRIESGINETLHCFVLSDLMNRHYDALQCVQLFEKYRHLASPSQILQYQAIVIGEKKAEATCIDEYEL
ncbi:helix-turn-helix transcriptional regulator [Brevibacillus brevis]|nr:helix-turn-helix transcriptional regulator [Brevibacillus brevis]